MRRTLLSLAVISILSSQGQTQSDDTALHLEKYPGLYSLVISRDNQIKFNRYFNGAKPEDVFDDQSLTKSMGSLLIGIPDYLALADRAGWMY